MVRCCCVKGCKNRRKPNDSLSFFRFPINNIDLLKQWRQVVPTNSLITKHTFICSDHFDDTSFKIVCGVRHLNKNAIPKFFDLGVLRNITHVQQKRNTSASVKDIKCGSFAVSKQLFDIPTIVKDEPSSTPMIVEVDPSFVDMIIKSEPSDLIVPENPKLPSTFTVFEGKKSPSMKKDKKNVATQVSLQHLAPSKMEEELRLKIKNLQNKLRHRDQKIRDVLHLLQELQKKDQTFISPTSRRTAAATAEYYLDADFNIGVKRATTGAN